MSKEEITIPLQFIEDVEKTAEKNGITVDELTERAMRKLLERGGNNVRN